MKLSFVFNRKNKQLAADETALIQLRIFAGVTRFMSTGLHVKQSQWNDKKKEIVRHQQKNAFNAHLQDLKIQVQNFQIQKIRSGQSFTAPDVIRHLQPEKDSKTFPEFIAGELLRLAGSLESSSIRAHQTMLNHLIRFAPNVSVYDVDYQFIRSFESYLQQQDKKNGPGKLDPNYIHCILVHVRRHVKEMHVLGLIQNDPFQKIRLTKVAKIPTWLTMDEILKLEKLEVKKRAAKVQAGFLFQCYTGIRYSDLKGLQRSDFRENKNGLHLIRTAQKTKKAGNQINLPLDRLFDGKPGIIAREWNYDFKTPVLDAYNRNLKTFAKAAGINKNLCSKMGRHSFAMNLQAEKVPLEIISFLLSHSSIKTTEIYKRMQNDVVNDYFNDM